MRKTDAEGHDVGSESVGGVAAGIYQQPPEVVWFMIIIYASSKVQACRMSLARKRGGL